MAPKKREPQKNESPTAGYGLPYGLTFTFPIAGPSVTGNPPPSFRVM